MTIEDDVDAGWLCKTRENNGDGTQDASYMIKEAGPLSLRETSLLCLCKAVQGGSAARGVLEEGEKRGPNE